MHKLMTMELRSTRARGAGRWKIAILACLVAGALLALVFLSPVLMQGLIADPARWRVLADVGQAYGGISAVLAGLAFCGIATSLLLQLRQIREFQVIAGRERHFELTRLALEYDDLRFPLMPETSSREYRVFVHLNQMVGYWSMLWQTDQVSGLWVRKHFDMLFADARGRAWWSRIDGEWDADPRGRRQKEFMAIAVEAHQAAKASGKWWSVEPLGKPAGGAGAVFFRRLRSALPGKEREDMRRSNDRLREEVESLRRVVARLESKSR